MLKRSQQLTVTNVNVNVSETLNFIMALTKELYFMWLGQTGQYQICLIRSA